MYNPMGFYYLPKRLVKKLSNRYSQNLLDTGEISTTDAIKAASKRTIQKE